jgi:hypothetical protein
MVAKSNLGISSKIQTPDGGDHLVVAKGGSIVVEDGGSLIIGGVPVDPSGGGLPAGGAVGQVVTKTMSGADWETPGAGGGLVSTGAIPLSAADITTLFSAPVTIIPAPGAGKAISLISGLVLYKFNSVAFDGPLHAGLNYSSLPNPQSDALIVLNDVFKQTASTFSAGLQAQETEPYYPTANIENAAIVLAGNADAMVGDGTAVVICTYYIVDLP